MYDLLLRNLASCSLIYRLYSPIYLGSRAPSRVAREGDLRFIEVFVDVPFDVVEQRNSKGFYKKARTGEIKGATTFTLIVDPCASTSDDNLASSRIHRRLCPI